MWIIDANASNYSIKIMEKWDKTQTKYNKYNAWNGSIYTTYYRSSVIINYNNKLIT